jgi:hypothetical protein
MGSRGIRRRKPANHLPKVHDLPESVGPPNVMWPDKRSGFEPSAYSPAGSAKNLWAFIGTLRNGHRRPKDRPSLSALLALLIGWAVIVLGVVFLTQFHP